ncbi:MAG: hypothetical protein IH859_04220 [Chloroflexi bacterium]|nr:hypothetical protein [Chloroflexota bacterium]
MSILRGASEDIRKTGGIIEIEIGPGSIIPGIRSEETSWITANALIDTGAFTTVIRQGIAEIFDLPPAGTIPAITPSDANAIEVPRYYVNLRPSSDIGFDLLAMEMPLNFTIANQKIDCLIGLDILTKGIFTLDGPNNTFSLEYD